VSDDPDQAPYRITDSRIVYENRWMRLREDTLERPDGSPGLYAYAEKSPSAIVLPLDGDEVVLIEQYRHAVGARFWELPQGAWDGHDAAPEELARGELAEETGLRAGQLEHLGRLYFAYGMSNQPVDAWLATDLSEGDQSLEPEEHDLRVGRFPLARVEKMLGAEIADAATVATFGLFRLRHSG
jgi:8-oxo-dGTP pyrophosphatase MutT (NUDIX family)